MRICFDFSVIPKPWTMSIIKPIPKSSSTDPCVPLNYRGISLLSCAAKIMSAILNNRLSDYYNDHGLVVDEQNGFRKGRSCAEHIFVLTTIIRHRLNYNLPTYVAFIDLEKVFDWVDRTLLFYKLLMNNINGRTYICPDHNY